MKFRGKKQEKKGNLYAWRVCRENLNIEITCLFHTRLPDIFQYKVESSNDGCVFVTFKLVKCYLFAFRKTNKKQFGNLSKQNFLSNTILATMNVYLLNYSFVIKSYDIFSFVSGEWERVWLRYEESRSLGPLLRLVWSRRSKTFGLISIITEMGLCQWK